MGVWSAAASPSPVAMAAMKPSWKSRMAAVWKRVLKIDQVGVHDNFFDVGGHSLLSMRVIARIEQETGVRLHPRLMFLENLEQLALRCDGQSASDSSAAAHPFAVASRAAVGM